MDLDEYNRIHDTEYRYNNEYTTSSVACSILQHCALGFTDRVRHYLYHVNAFKTGHTSDILYVADIWEADWNANPFPRTTTASDLGYENLKPNFCYLPVSIIKKTFQVSTQYAKMPASTTLFKRFKTPHPFANCFCRNEDVASDTVYADTPVIDCGHKCA